MYELVGRRLFSNFNWIIQCDFHIELMTIFIIFICHLSLNELMLANAVFQHVIETLIWIRTLPYFRKFDMASGASAPYIFTTIYFAEISFSRRMRPYAGKLRTHRYLFASSEKASTTNKQTTLCGFFHCVLLPSTELWNLCKIPSISTSWLCLWTPSANAVPQNVLVTVSQLMLLMLAIRIYASHKTGWDQFNCSVNDLSLNKYFASATLHLPTMDRLCDAFAFYPDLRLAPHRPMCARRIVCDVMWRSRLCIGISGMFSIWQSAA